MPTTQNPPITNSVPLGMGRSLLWSDPPNVANSPLPDTMPTKILLKSLSHLPKELPIGIHRYIVHESLVAVAPDTYKQALLEILAENGIKAPVDIRRLTRTLQQQYKAVRHAVDPTVLGAGLTLTQYQVTIPSLTTPMEEIRTHSAQVFGNPVSRGVAAIADAAMAGGLTNLLKPLSGQVFTDFHAFTQEIAGVIATGDITVAQLTQAMTFYQDIVTSNLAQIIPSQDDQRVLVRALSQKFLKVVEGGAGTVETVIQTDISKVKTFVQDVNGAVKLVSRVADQANVFYTNVTQQSNDVQSLLSKFQAFVVDDNTSDPALNGDANVDTRFLMDTLRQTLQDTIPSKDDIIVTGSSLFQIPDAVVDPDGFRLLKQDVMQKQLDMVDTVKDYLQSGSELFDIAANQLGLSGPVLDAGRDILKVGTVIADTVSDLATGNYLGAIGSVFGGLFGGGPDAATLRQQQIMNELGKIDGKVDKLLKGEQTILDGLKEIDTKINQLYEIVVQNHAEEMQALYEIQYQVWFATQLIDTIIRNELNPARTNLRADDSSPTYLPLPDFLNMPFEQRKAEYDNNAEAFTALMTVVESFVANKGMSNFFALNGYLQPAQGTHPQYVDDIAQPTLQYLKSKYPMPEDYRRAIFSLTTPSLTITDLESKPRNVQVPDPLPIYGADDSKISNFEQFVQYASINYYVDLVVRLNPYYTLIKWPERDRLLNTMELADPSTYQTINVESALMRSKSRLEVANYLMNLTVSQQTMMAGDILLPYLSVDLLSSDATTYGNALKVLRYAEEIRINTARYLLSSRYRAKGIDKLSYQVAFTSKDDFYLGHLFNTKADGTDIQPHLQFQQAETFYLHAGIRQKQMRWNLIFADPQADNPDDPEGNTKKQMRIPLPTPDELDQGVLLPTAGLVNLIPLRATLLEQLVSAQYKDKLSSKDNGKLNLLSLIQ